MNQEEIRRRRTSDPEIDAMAVISQAMDPLDHVARIRVLEWADERFGKQTGAFGVILRFASSVQAAAERMHVPQAEVVKALNRVEPAILKDGLALVDHLEEETAAGRT